MANEIIWDEANFLWNENSHIWNLVVEIVESIKQGAGFVEAYEQLEPEKKKRFISLICKVKGLETYSGQKTIRDDIEITAEDVKLVVEKVLDINLTIENIQI